LRLGGSRKLGYPREPIHLEEQMRLTLAGAVACGSGRLGLDGCRTGAAGGKIIPNWAIHGNRSLQRRDATELAWGRYSTRPNLPGAAAPARVDRCRGWLCRPRNTKAKPCSAGCVGGERRAHRLGRYPVLQAPLAARWRCLLPPDWVAVRFVGVECKPVYLTKIHILHILLTGRTEIGLT
jgi:hypothetical protein